jgi:hypothetical protein
MLIVFQKELSNHGLVEVMLLLRLLDSRAPTNQYNFQVPSGWLLMQQLNRFQLLRQSILYQNRIFRSSARKNLCCSLVFIYLSCSFVFCRIVADRLCLLFCPSCLRLKCSILSSKLASSQILSIRSLACFCFS